MTASRRWAAYTAVLTALTTLLAGCASGTHEGESAGGDRKAAPDTHEGGQNAEQQPRLIGDGSTSVTGAQPHQPTPRKLKPGEKPPQFVVFSWDGAGEDGNALFSRFRKVAKENDASMTYFLSGIYLLPEKERERYEAPGRGPGASDIGYLRDENIKATLQQLRGAWLEGSEIGTHFNGHFCGPEGVDSWSTEDWKSEISQAKWFVKNWKTTTGWKTSAALPFDYEKELIGGRTPCLEGRKNLLPAAKEMGFRYDSSGNGTQVWPGKEEGMWDLPLQQVPMPGRAFETLAMDYNFLVNQSQTVNGPPAMHDTYEEQMYDGLMQGFERAYDGNRAPMIIGNHFEQWNDGIYMDAIEDVVEDVCGKKDVRCVSFRQLVDWLDVQDPKTLAKLRTLPVGAEPEDGWRSFLTTKAKSSGSAAQPGA
ncbi:hypothetical protein DVA86_14185 [Streptomyces armeniacus]|uniref:Polysaccharide deacetylase n=1 Tax=Streptomyces armeniacus TaxID=83291 RepID=A0A345XPR7_9ACTN|nr:hypothetical protein [Streptomyces armeniacus]AXK33633.1 hypothetical protein DVA86_14185 [Streptomyces armeniacus]